MLIFIVPLRSPKTCSNWADVSNLCNSTLRSLLRQTSPNFQIILCCNELPLNFQPHAQIFPIVEDFLIPTTWLEGISDIHNKVKRSMIEARQFGASFIMRVDADDLVSKHLVEYTDKHQNSDGWYLRWGYIYPIGEDYIYLRPKFTAISGSSNILKCEVIEFPESMGTPKQDWLEPVWQHLNVNKLLIPYHKQLAPLPFPGVIFRTHADNMSGSNMGTGRFSNLKNIILKKVFRRKLSTKLLDEFTIELK